jgi:transcription antitermination factor NusG
MSDDIVATGRAASPSTYWLVVWTRSRHEQRVHDQLLAKGIEAFLPTITRMSRWKDRTKRIKWPLFPGYCFARFTPEQNLSVLQCRGVAHIVSFDGTPAHVDDYEVESLRLLVNSELRYDPCPFLHEGSMVEVTGGPLKGMVGRLLRKDAARARLVLSVDLIRQSVSVHVDMADVRSM